MSNSLKPPLPPAEREGDERTTLVAMLERLRAVLLRKTHGLSDEQMATPLSPSRLTLAGLLLHMAFVEDVWFDRRFRDNPERHPWADFPWDEDPDHEMNVANRWHRDDIVAQFEKSVARSRVIVDETASLDAVARRTRPDGTGCNLRWILVHMIEEYARHCGHADYLREHLDGVVGD